MSHSIPSALRAALDARGYTALTQVQEAVLGAPAAADLLVSAQTGSGKTVAYGLALAPTLLGDEQGFGRPGLPLALVVAPTRELAVQVHAELTWLYAQAGGRVVSCIGGMDARREAQSLAGGCHVVVGTPGRLCDHLGRGRLQLGALRAVVLDEADEMLDLGFRDELERLLDASPEGRRTLLFSATVPAPIAEMARAYQTDALRVEVGHGVQHADIEHRVVRVVQGEIEHAVVNVLRLIGSPASMVFCATRESVRHLHASLVERGFESVALSGELSQPERSRAVHALRTGRARVCVATDVAARGLDLPDLGLVIHAELPQTSETLLHRSGRTGRAGRKGISVLVVPDRGRRRATALLHGARVQASWIAAPDPEQIRAADQERLLSAPMFEGDPTDDERAAAALLLERLGPERIATALIREHRRALPEPEEITAAGHTASRPMDEGLDGPTWFSVAVGRRDKADPRWLIPLICRAGPIRKNDIGAIRIFDDQTLFEVRGTRAGAFADAITARDGDEVRFAPANPPASGRASPRSAAPQPRWGPRAKHVGVGRNQARLQTRQP